jgi:hypothetical protein
MLGEVKTYRAQRSAADAAAEPERVSCDEFSDTCGFRPDQWIEERGRSLRRLSSPRCR